MQHEISIEAKACQNILIVEDQRPDQVLVEGKVRELWPNCKIIPVSSMQQAYRACKDYNFDMVLLDLNLPDNFGPNSVSDMRRMDSQVPIIVITGMLSDVTVYESLRNGANGVLSKQQVMQEKAFFDVLKQNARA